MFASRQTAMYVLYQCMFYTNNIITGACGPSGAFYLDNSLSCAMIRVDLFVITLSVRLIVSVIPSSMTSFVKICP